jgi:hypothetical protein
MNVAEFVAKWSESQLRESQGAQSHFNDLCRLLGQDEPATADPNGEFFCFEREAAKQSGRKGWADVWKKGFFGWEYKGKHKNLDAAYEQLLEYHDKLENTPLLVVCDMDQIVIHTHFTGTSSIVYRVTLANLYEPRSLEILRAVFCNPEDLKPGAMSRAITEDAARLIAEIAQSLRDRGAPSRDVAHFLDRIVFCLFAEDVGLLPPRLFSRILENCKGKTAVFVKTVRTLFETMAEGGLFGADSIAHFNGNLFDATDVLELTREEIGTVLKASRLDWGAVDPSIFGTLFERGLDPDKRSQLGAHYTSREDIETLVEPVVMTPLRRDWARVHNVVEWLLATGEKPLNAEPGILPAPQPARPLKPNVLKKARDEGVRAVYDFLRRLATVKVLDPACGSGNFLYVTLQKLKDLERDAILFANKRLGVSYMPMVGPWQMFGIEINPYAHDLTQMTVWIGYLQWASANGFMVKDDPILRPLDNFQCMDAILDLSDPDNPKEPEWPSVDFVVGNPPFLGDKLMRGGLGDDYVEKLRNCYHGRVPGGADLCCYWFEKARRQIEAGHCGRAGLLATQGIRGGANREVLKSILDSGNIFFAQSDRPWVLDGANVHVSMVGFDSGLEHEKRLNGLSAALINANLTAFADTTKAAVLEENTAVSFLGSCKGGPFDIEEVEALTLLHSFGNPHGRPNSDVVRPVFNGEDLIGKRGSRWIIDNANLELETACKYESPHQIVNARVKPLRDKNRNKWLRENWWRPQRMRPDMRAAIAPLARFLVTTTTSKHRLFLWLNHPSLPDHQLIVFARSDDCFFGVLHSRIHEVWTRALGTQLREKESGFRYTPTTCFETFPLPHPTPEQGTAIAAAAKELDDLRNRWLNPPEWTREEVLEFPGSADGPWARYVHDPDARGIGTVRWPRIVAKDEAAATQLAKRTLTNLYNLHPEWLDLAHKKLDAAVFAAYGWPDTLTDEEILERLLALNLERATK